MSTETEEWVLFKRGPSSPMPDFWDAGPHTVHRLDCSSLPKGVEPKYGPMSLVKMIELIQEHRASGWQEVSPIHACKRCAQPVRDNLLLDLEEAWVGSPCEACKGTGKVSGHNDLVAICGACNGWGTTDGKTKPIKREQGKYAGLSLRFVRTLKGLPAKYASAAEAFAAQPEDTVHSDFIWAQRPPAYPPLGTVVWYRTVSGNCALAVDDENGMVLGLSRNGTPKMYEITSPHLGEYLGWTETIL